MFVKKSSILPPKQHHIASFCIPGGHTNRIPGAEFHLEKHFCRWTRSISRHLAPMIEILAGIYRGNRIRHQGFSGGVKWISSSTVCVLCEFVGKGQNFHLLKNCFYFPLLVLKGVYHYWRGLKQIEGNSLLFPFRFSESCNQRYHFGVGASPISVGILVGMGMFTGYGTILGRCTTHFSLF